MAKRQKAESKRYEEGEIVYMKVSKEGKKKH
jgi:hypothetical protein